MRDSSSSGPDGIVNVRKDICMVSRGELRWKTQHSQLGNWINSINGEPQTPGGSTGKQGRLRACVHCFKGKCKKIVAPVQFGPVQPRRGETSAPPPLEDSSESWVKLLHLHGGSFPLQNHLHFKQRCARGCGQPHKQGQVNVTRNYITYA